MKYLVTVVLGALVTGTLLSVAVYWSLGPDAGLFFARFLAGPAGLVCAFIVFIVYDHYWPGKRRSDKT